MALGIYKPGQGYWVRTLTAVFAGILVLSAAAYGWQQAELVRIPVESYTLELTSPEGEVQPGQVVDLTMPDPDPAAEGASLDIGDARVVAVEGDRLIVTDPVLESDVVEGTAIGAASGVRSQPPTAGGGAGPEFRAGVAGYIPTYAFPRIYIQAGVASLIILVGAAVIYWLVGVRRPSAEFLINTDGEMRKVNWSTYREIRGSTIVVITAAFLIAAILFCIDLVFKWFFTLIDVIQS